MKKISILILALFIVLNTETLGYAKTCENNKIIKTESAVKVNKYISSERLLNNFTKYVKIDTGSDESKAATQTPSTKSQFELAKVLYEDLKRLGLKDVKIADNSVVTATLPGSSDNMPIIGLSAHMDTSSTTATGPVNPKVHVYKGGDIVLKDNTIIPASDLQEYIGQTVITSDGTTLLGADDKAGIAEITEAITVLINHPEIKRPTIRIAFTPDEETGFGAESLNLKEFGADYAYTVDGSHPRELDVATFYAYNPTVIITGKQVHYGYAYGKMINSLEAAGKFIAAMPSDETPATTKDKEGYILVESIEGTPEKTTIQMVVRDFYPENMQKRLKFIQKTLKKLEKDYPGCKTEFTENKRYENMSVKLKEFPEVTEYAKTGIINNGFDCREMWIRGGTDGARLTLYGLPTPNLGAGGVNFHSKSEFVTVEIMKDCTANIISILKVWAEKSPEIMPKILERRKNLK